ncbi:MAG: phosphatase PAP2 family protein [Hyphomicrobium sp.]|uniref:phosphatase PAP2 family protein n=1 Tax=Hyphomicrobium sp. TaxID=82 RepID=UPI003D107526
MAAVDPYSPEEMRFRREFLIGAALLAIPLAALMVSSPGIDLAISAFAKGACTAPMSGNRWCATWSVSLARNIFLAIFVLVSLVTLVATVRIVRAKGRWLGAEQARCWFMIAVLVVGPGVVSNLILKDNLGRARPRDVVEFGGAKTFTPALTPSSECPRNCSFVSGEASSMFAVFFGLAMLLPQYRLGLVVAGLATGVLAGSIRIIQGAHFMSDVLFAGIVMALTVSVLHMFFIGMWRNPRATRDTLTAPFTPLVRVASAAWVR